MSNSLAVSFEFFPPKTDQGRENLKQAQQELSVLNPQYYSVTFGAGGSTRDRTFEVVEDIQASTSVDATPHLSCIGSTRENISNILERYKNAGIKRIVSLRGDIPEGMTDTGEFHYANELVSFIRDTTGDSFHLEVAAYPETHPEASGAKSDLQNFKRKVDAGANGAITQYFFNPDAYFHFVENCRAMDINIPIVPGIMPITNFKQLANFSSICGAEIPRWLSYKLQDFGDDLESLREFGIDFITSMCEQLISQGIPGLHFYTLNKSGASIEICKRLGLNG